MSTHITMENIFMLIVSLFRDYVCLMEKQNMRVVKQSADREFCSRNC